MRQPYATSRSDNHGMIRLGGLWKNETKDGKTYLAGSFGGARLMIFPNGYKEKDSDPDYVVTMAQSQPKKDKAENKKPDSFDL